MPALEITRRTSAQWSESRGGNGGVVALLDADAQDAIGGSQSSSRHLARIGTRRHREDTHHGGSPGSSDRHWHAARFSKHHTHTEPSPTLPEGTTPESHNAPSPAAEADWLARRLTRMLADGDAVRIGILTRTHRRSEAISNALTAYRIPHLTVEEFDFFRRQEIKDLLARLRLLLNPSDNGSLQRITQRPASGIGNATFRNIWTEAQPCALKITDLAQLHSHNHGEPFQTLLDALSHGTVVVFDVETTGLSPDDDEVIDLGAVKLQAGQPVAEFDTLLRPSRGIGDSEAVHGISEQTLFQQGRDPMEVF